MKKIFLVTLLALNLYSKDVGSSVVIANNIASIQIEGGFVKSSLHFHIKDIVSLELRQPVVLNSDIIIQLSAGKPIRLEIESLDIYNKILEAYKQYNLKEK